MHVRFLGRANASNTRHAQLANLLGSRHRAWHLQIYRFLAGVTAVDKRQRAASRKARALHAAHVGHAGNIKGTGKLGTNLGRIAVNCHLAANEQVKVLVERLDATFEGIGGSQGIGTRKGAIG